MERWEIAYLNRNYVYTVWFGEKFLCGGQSPYEAIQALSYEQDITTGIDWRCDPYAAVNGVRHSSNGVKLIGINSRKTVLITIIEKRAQS